MIYGSCNIIAIPSIALIQTNNGLRRFLLNPALGLFRELSSLYRHFMFRAIYSIKLLISGFSGVIVSIIQYFEPVSKRFPGKSQKSCSHIWWIVSEHVVHFSHLNVAVRPDPSSVSSPLCLLELDYGGTCPNPAAGGCDERRAMAHVLCFDDDHIYGFLETGVCCWRFPGCDSLCWIEHLITTT